MANRSQTPRGLAVLAALAATSLPATAQTTGTVGPQIGPVVGATVAAPGGLVVGLHDAADLQAFTQDWGVLCVGATSIGATFELEASAMIGSSTPAKVSERIALDPRVRFVEPNQPLQAPEGKGCLAPPSTVSGLPCTISFYDGDPAPTKYYQQPLTPIIDLGGAQVHLTGIPTTVAVIDTGIDPTHPLFAGRFAGPGFDFLTGQVGGLDIADGLDNDLDGLADEAHGHGTHVAGTIALINPDAKLLPLRVLDSDGNGTAFDVAEAIYFALENGAQVINLSLGMDGVSVAVVEALQLARAMDVDVYAAAGNQGALGVSFPASHRTVLAVTAVDDLDVKAAFASYGPEVAIAAPGVDIYSAMPGDAWAWWSGTSMATAVVSGVGSLVYSLDPLSDDGAEDVAESVEPIGLQNPGLDGLIGRGRVDAGETAEEVLHLED